MKPTTLPSFLFSIILTYALLSHSSLLAQTSGELPWHLCSQEVDGIPGIALPQARALLGDHRPTAKVKVAILDTGLELNHRAFKGALHTNQDEIPSNGIDDDRNGYIDDVHGWNFLVDSLGQNLQHARYEVAYIQHLHDSLTSSKLPIPSWLNDMDMDLVHLEYERIMEYYDECWFWTELYVELAEPFYEVTQSYPESFEQLWFFRRDIDLDRSQKKLLKTLCDLQVKMEDTEAYIYDAWDLDEYWVNPNFNPRAVNEPAQFYGNGNCDERIKGHGTHVAGIIGANDYPGAESFGVAAGLVEVLPIRMLVDGDEVDKDVANAIRYAVDEGAQIINMSFGKYVSMHPDSVRSALKYAADHDVLIVHAAGNEATNIDNFPFYPNHGRLRDVDSIFINVGASGSAFDLNLLADFSNFGKRNVDIFAPGVNILSATSNNEYEYLSGTSMAAPVVAGIGALLRAYFPEFTAAEIKRIILDSAVEPEFRVVEPGAELSDYVIGQSMKKFCKSGGLANARQAVLEALEFREEKAADVLANQTILK